MRNEFCHLPCCVGLLAWDFHSSSVGLGLFSTKGIVFLSCLVGREHRRRGGRTTYLDGESK